MQSTAIQPCSNRARALSTHPEQSRAIAARLLTAVARDGQTSDQALSRLPADPLARDMFYGSLRHYFSLSAAVDALVKKPLRPADQDIRCLVLVGAYQLRFSRIPDHAAIHETVSACKVLNKPWAAKLVNAVLRAIQRDDETERSVYAEYPAWIIDRINCEYGNLAGAILQASLERAPQTLRVNLQKCGPSRYRHMLEEHEIGFQPGYRDEYLVLDQPLPSRELPGHSDGLIAVQDAGAGFGVGLLALAPGDRVLDACAAPGGKLFHMLECQPGIMATALDKSSSRVQHLNQEASRLGHSADTRIADATTVDWWDREPFDVVLVDAPCTGSGTLRRHPDIKILRTELDLERYSRLQLSLLTNLWRTLRPGGSLLYCTCSLFAEENDLIVGEFLTTAEGAAVQGISLPTGIPRKLGWQLLPTDRRTDGFYYALLKKEETRQPT
jgi:16S rRNA (cytosine967-C5)-methyltransferase